MKRNLWKRVGTVALCAVLGCGVMAGFSGCGGSKSDTLVVMSEELNGLFNPFFSTAGTDMDVVGQTQIGMLSTGGEGEIVYGNDEPVVTLDYDTKKVGNDTEYYFVIKRGLTFSDGTPLSINDVLFNMYVYLDPAYTGSTTMYSTKIKGLNAYRTQIRGSDTGSSQEDEVNSTAQVYAYNRMKELIDIYRTFKVEGFDPTNPQYEATIDQMVEKIETWTPKTAYKNAIGEQDTEKARAQLLADYYRVVGDPNGATDEDKKGLFKQELENDFKSAKDSYTEEPYKSAPVYATASSPEALRTGFDEVISFMFAEGYVEIEYEKDNNFQDDRSRIKKAILSYNTSVVKDQQSAVNFVYNATIPGDFDSILNYWATGDTLRSEFVSKAIDVILNSKLTDGELVVKNIDGIRSLGHDASYTENTVKLHEGTANEKEYRIAKQHKDDGTPANEGEYDVLKITVEGTDPKAIWNFAFTVAPYHYYSDPAQYPVNIASDQFGVKWGSFDFMSKVIQGTSAAKFGAQSKNRVPLGAGPYVATDVNNSDNPDGNAFISNNVVYYKANEKFFEGVEGKGETLHAPYIKKMVYQVVSSSNAIDSLEKGSVHFVEPQFTKENADRLKNELQKKGFNNVSTWQLGYGYIGINAGKVPNIFLRRAIMAAMDISLALEYYQSGTVENIYWPMSLVSWAYPRKSGTTLDPTDYTANAETVNDTDDAEYGFPHVPHDYTHYADTPEEAITNIRNYMSQAGTYSESDLKLTFTIAGSNLTEHPCYQVFKTAAELLNQCGWKIEVMPDTNALTKLATGSLAVWAAAWGSTIDPDMYQVYHKKSTATSVYSWGYREILGAPATYPTETKILDALSTVIDDARKTDDQGERTDLYRIAMSYVLDLAVELPVYQRQTLYAYNANVIDADSLPKDINPYTSPLSRIWEVKFKD